MRRARGLDTEKKSYRIDYTFIEIKNRCHMIWYYIPLIEGVKRNNIVDNGK